jgi:hypothetical protein
MTTYPQYIFAYLKIPIEIFKNGATRIMMERSTTEFQVCQNDQLPPVHDQTENMLTALNAFLSRNQNVSTEPELKPENTDDIPNPEKTDVSNTVFYTDTSLLSPTSSPSIMVSIEELNARMPKVPSHNTTFKKRHKTQPNITASTHRYSAKPRYAKPV